FEMETKPLISVLLPVYRHEAYLMDAVQSIIRQTYENWELIILEDDSDIHLLDYENLDSRINVIPTIEHYGKWYRINNGLYRSSGQYIAFQDADDISIPQRFELSLKHIGDADFLYGDSIYLLSNGTQKYVRAPEQFDLDYLKQKSLGNQGSYFFKKGLPNYPEVGYGDDRCWLIECLKTGIKTQYLPLPLYYYRNYTSNFRINSFNKIQTIFARIHRTYLNYKLQKYVNQQQIT
ncbi:MAG: glycosyltransferase family 2 protein, partial [Candidatus Hodarchaeota archaeon]